MIQRTMEIVLLYNNSIPNVSKTILSLSIYIKMYFPFDIRLGDDKTIKHVIINNVNKYSHICYAYSTSTYETTKHN